MCIRLNKFDYLANKCLAPKAAVREFDSPFVLANLRKGELTAPNVRRRAAHAAHTTPIKLLISLCCRSHPLLAPSISRYIQCRDNELHDGLRRDAEYEIKRRDDDET